MTFVDLGLIRHGRGVYLIRNTVNGKVYVGSTVDLRVRLVDHFWELAQGKHRNGHLQNAWNKYGKFAFEFEILEDIDVDDILALRIAEEYWIRSYVACDRRYGYNQELRPSYGSSTKRFSEETIEKLKAAARRRMSNATDERRQQLAMWVKVNGVSCETRAKISQSLTGRTLSEETIEKKRIAGRGRTHSTATKDKLSQAKLALPQEVRSQIGKWNLGRQQTDGHKKKAALARVGSKRSEETKAKMAAARKAWWAAKNANLSTHC
jgi:group I intron endonuclease